MFLTYVIKVDMFLTYVIKVDKREVLELYLQHIHVLLLFLFFQENYPYAFKVNSQLGHIHDLMPWIRPI